MLDINYDNGQVINAFDLVPCRVEIPKEWVDYFFLTGNTPATYEDERKFSRYYFRHKAIIERKGALHTVYTKDLSRSGIGLLHHEQLFPCEKLAVWLPNKSRMLLRVTRCMRIQEHCYECGTVFEMPSN